MNSYTLGADSSPMAVIGHTGELGSFNSAYWTFSETESAVIVMTNASSTYGDPSNIVAQVLIKALFEIQPAIYYEKLASEVLVSTKAKWQETLDAWSAKRKVGTHLRELKAYVETHESKDLKMTLRISALGEESLRLCINDLPQQQFDLYHYHLDTWIFLTGSYDQCLELGMGYYLLDWGTFNISFDRLVAGTFRGLTWLLDFDPRAEPHVFGT